MNILLDLIFRSTTALGDLLFAALSWMSPLAALLVISSILGIIMLWAWGKTSNQKAISHARSQITAHLLATRLFRDNLWVTFRAQRMILWNALKLMGLSLRPLLIMLVPITLVIAQVGLRYEQAPFPAGTAARVKLTTVRSKDCVPVSERLRLPDGITQTASGPLRIPALRTVDWRVTASRPGTYELGIGDSSNRVTIPLLVGNGFERISSVRGGRWYDRLLYSAEPSIAATSAVEKIELLYPRRSTPIFGYDIHWLITLTVVSMLAALVAKPILGVKI